MWPDSNSNGCPTFSRQKSRVRLYGYTSMRTLTVCAIRHEQFIPILAGKGILPCVGRFRGFPLYLELN